MVAHLTGGQGVAGSNPVAPTIDIGGFRGISENENTPENWPFTHILHTLM